MSWRDIVARGLVALSAAGVFYSFARFGPAALDSPDLTPYTKNHIVRELGFGAAVGIYVSLLCAVGRSLRDYWTSLILGGLISFVFWVAMVAGYGTAGMEQVWQGRGVTSEDAYRFHVPQTVLFVIGALLLPRPARSKQVARAQAVAPVRS